MARTTHTVISSEITEDKVYVTHQISLTGINNLTVAPRHGLRDCARLPDLTGRAQCIIFFYARSRRAVLPERLKRNACYCRWGAKYVVRIPRGCVEGAFLFHLLGQ